jgi:hypothetical protein
MRLARALNDLAIVAYAPCYLKVQKVFSFVKEYERPLFPTYLFAAFDYHVRKSAVQLLPLKMKSRVVGELDDAMICELKDREDHAGHILLRQGEKAATANRPFKHGDSLVYSGMSRFEAVFDSYTSDDERVVILATMFNQQKLMPVSIYDLAMAV